MISTSNPLALGIRWLYVARLWTNHARRPLSARRSGASSRVSGVTLFLPSRLCRHTLVAIMQTNGGFLNYKNVGTPNHPKSEHFSIETHADIY